MNTKNGGLEYFKCINPDCGQWYPTQGQLEIFGANEKAERAIENYTRLSLEIASTGSMTAFQREEVRSFAAEAIGALLRANPDRWRYANEMRDVMDAQRQR